MSTYIIYAVLPDKISLTKFFFIKHKKTESNDLLGWNKLSKVSKKLICLTLPFISKVNQATYK